MSHKREPVGNTCPDINRILKRISDAVSYAKMITTDEDDGTKELVNDILYELDVAADEIENIRASNQSLRSWGKEEAIEVDNLNTKILEYEEVIRDLKGD